MPHMLAQQHVSHYDAVRAGPVGLQSTIAAAVSAIGSVPTTLVWTMSGTGVWSITSNISTPSNIRHFIPPGVTVNVASGVTWACAGPIFACDSTWKTGAGVVTKSVAPIITEISGIFCTTYHQSSSGTGTIWQIDNALATGPGIEMYIDSGGNSTGIGIIRNEAAPTTTGWQFLVNASNQLLIARPGAGPRLLINDTGIMVGANVAPTHVLQMGVDDAFKATANWSTASDSRIKTVQGDYTDGLTTVLALPQPVRFVFNGKAGTPTDGKEQIGMIAQDVQPVTPYMVSTYPDYLDPTDPAPSSIFSMNNSAMVYMLVNAVKDLNALIQALTTRVTALETP
jgi:hypothetical protein